MSLALGLRRGAALVLSIGSSNSSQHSADGFFNAASSFSVLRVNAFTPSLAPQLSWPFAKLHRVCYTSDAPGDNNDISGGGSALDAAKAAGAFDRLSKKERRREEKKVKKQKKPAEPEGPVKQKSKHKKLLLHLRPGDPIPPFYGRNMSHRFGENWQEKVRERYARYRERKAREAANEQARLQFENDTSVKWQLIGTALVQRLPILLPVQPEWERKYREWQAARYQEQLKATGLDFEKIKQENSELPAELRVPILPTPIYELYEEQQRLRDLREPGRYNTPEEDADMKNMRRMMYHFIYLIIKKPGESLWQFPQCSWVKGETIRQTAERGLREEFGGEYTTYFNSNSPIGHYVYKFGADHRKVEDYGGAKMYFFSAHYMSGKVQTNEKLTDYLWVTRDELPQFISPEMHKSMKRILPPNFAY